MFGGTDNILHSLITWIVVRVRISVIPNSPFTFEASKKYPSMMKLFAILWCMVVISSTGMNSSAEQTNELPTTDNQKLANLSCVGGIQKFGELQKMIDNVTEYLTDNPHAYDKDFETSFDKSTDNISFLRGLFKNEPARDCVDEEIRNLRKQFNESLSSIDRSRKWAIENLQENRKVIKEKKKLLEVCQEELSAEIVWTESRMNECKDLLIRSMQADFVTANVVHQQYIKKKLKEFNDSSNDGRNRIWDCLDRKYHCKKWAGDESVCKYPNIRNSE